MIQLVMFPYAGSIVNPYKEWLSLEDQQFKIIQIEYDGRGKRSAYSRPVTWRKLIENTLGQVMEHVDFTKEYILFGHSMGARVAADIYNKLTEMSVQQPRCLIFSGTEAFRAKSYESILSAPVKKFNQFFFKMGGIPAEVIQEVELLELVTDYLREDLKLLNQFTFRWKKSTVTCPVLIFNGVNEDRSELRDWVDLLGPKCEQTIFEGDHFFIRNNVQEILTVIKKKIDETS
ncbi:hypothetical protein IW492_08525 [Enterococcus sp. BWB1-3]|uniref:thioesterase II family protein n=1 Tax=unclassified Enterococcus TaxID=2608891 RepID=UPI00192055A9|nr:MULTISPECIES: thioesterase domain-containing protein [unclassified Enterococcus]MBL1229275.1 hypothetical protein [Enterococcus sp. BWB1-3]MCB5951765.1 hypothetical protein [Enterococcus sp. BWT-B8]